MARRVKIRESAETTKGEDSAVEFEFKGQLLTSVSAIPVSTLLNLGSIMQLVKEADSDEPDGSAMFEMFQIQYDLVLSMLEKDSRKAFQEMVDAPDSSVDMNDLANISTTLMEEIMGNDQASSTDSSDTTSTTDISSTAPSSQPGTNLLMTATDLLS